MLLGGSEEVKAKYLSRLTEERKLASFGLTEPAAGSDEGTSQIQRLVIAREVLMPRHIAEPTVSEPAAVAA